jgi:hypothetical protein
LIAPATHPGITRNITMPSVMRAPAALGIAPYWMYFAAHDGHYIRLAHADAVEGPWTVYAPGSLKDTEVAPFSDTISSPDVSILPSGRIRMYFSTDRYPGSTEQWSGVAESDDGIHFTLASPENIAKYYLRTFEWDGMHYALQKGWGTAPAELGVSRDGIERFAFIKTLAGGSIRHVAVLRTGATLLVFYSTIGDAPERIYLSTIQLDAGPPETWDLSPPVEVLRPELAYEGVDAPIAPSAKGPRPACISCATRTSSRTPARCICSTASPVNRASRSPSSATSCARADSRSTPSRRPPRTRARGRPHHRRS